MKPNITFADAMQHGVSLRQPLTSAEIDKLQRQLGRPLSLSEILNGEISREDTRTSAERMAAENRRVKLNEPKLSPIEQAIAMAEQELGEERLAKMSSAERKLAMLKEARAAQEKLKQADAAHETRLQTLKPQIEKLRTLRERVRWDAEWSASEVEAIDFALDALTTKGSDVAAAVEAYNAAITIDRNKTLHKRDLVQQKLMELGAEQSQLNEAMRRFTPEDDEQDATSTVVYDEAEEKRLWQAYQATMDGDDQAAWAAASSAWAKMYDARPKTEAEA